MIKHQQVLGLEQMEKEKERKKNEHKVVDACFGKQN